MIHANRYLGYGAGSPRSVFADMPTQVAGKVTVATSHKKTLFRELFGTRRNGHMAPFLKALLVAVAICSAGVVVAFLVTALAAGQIAPWAR